MAAVSYVCKSSGNNISTTHPVCRMGLGGVEHCSMPLLTHSTLGPKPKRSWSLKNKSNSYPLYVNYAF